MIYRVCKSFEIENGHMLSKHPGRCRMPHGHSRKVELVIASDHLDDNEMVCDFKSLKLAVETYIDQYDHALMINSDDPFLKTIPRRIYDYVAQQIKAGGSYTDPNGHVFTLPTHLTLERVRVSETSSSWAEYGI